MEEEDLQKVEDDHAANCLSVCLSVSSSAPCQISGRSQKGRLMMLRLIEGPERRKPEIEVIRLCGVIIITFLCKLGKKRFAD